MSGLQSLVFQSIYTKLIPICQTLTALMELLSGIQPETILTSMTVILDEPSVPSYLQQVRWTL